MIFVNAYAMPQTILLMQQLEKLLLVFCKSKWIAVSVMFFWCAASILFFEKLEANNGLGWDGARYADIATHLFNSNELDSYTIMRILPSLLVHYIFTAFGIEFSPQNIVLGFEILNTTLLCISVFLTLGIFEHYQFSNAKKALGLTLVFCSYASLNFPFYYTVMTDTAGFTIAISAFYFFIKQQTWGLRILGFAAAFTWPIALLQVLALLFFNQHSVTFKPLSKLGYVTLFAIGFAWGYGLSFFFLVLKGETNDMAYTLPIDTNLLWLSIPSIGILSGLAALLLGNKTFFECSYWKKHFTIQQIFFPVILLVLVVLMVKSIELKQSGYASAYFLLKGVIYAAAKPFMVLVSSVNYFGVAVLVAILLGKETISTAGKLGLGFCAAIVINLLAVGMRSEVRIISNVFPWLALLVAIALKDKKLPAMFYAAVLLLNIFFSKIWLKVNTPEKPTMNADGTIGMPQQKFFMNLGSWMSSEVWLMLLIATTCAFIALYICLHQPKLKAMKLKL